jgi:hypothetical protein
MGGLRPWVGMQPPQIKPLNTRPLCLTPLHSVPQGNAVFVYGKRLYQEWLVDGYAKVEAERLKFVRYNQTQLRAELYQGVVDAQAADVDPHEVGRSIVLPSSFIGGPRHCI